MCYDRIIRSLSCAVVNYGQAMMKLKKIHIFCLLTMLLGGILSSPGVVAAADNPEDIVQMSASKFWEEVSGTKLEGDAQEYIICGYNSCKVGQKRCIVHEETRRDVATGLDYYLGGFLGSKGVIALLRGEGEVTTYEYRCIDIDAPIPDGFSEATEGGYVFRKKIVTGGLRGFFAGDKSKEKGICSTGSDGNAYCLAARNGMATVNYNAADTAFRGCEVLPVKLYNGRKCFFCPLFTVVYKVAGDITGISFKALAPAFAITIALGLAIWIAVQTLNHVSSLTKQDAPKFLTGLIKQSYKFLIAFCLLQFSSQIFEYGVVPVLKAGLDFGDALLDEKYTAIKTDIGLSDLNKMEEVNPGILKRISTLTNTDYYNGDLYLKLDNFVVALQRNIAFMQGVGSSLICIGTNALMFKGNEVSFKHGFVLTIQGVLLAGFGFLFAIAFAFYLLDAVVQMGIAGALMPFLIACWPFKLTAKYANTGWSMILNSAFVFAFTGLVLSVSLNLIDAALNFVATEAQTEVSESSGNIGGDGSVVNVGGLYKIAQAINSQNEEQLVTLTDMSTVGFLILVFCCIFGFKFLGRAGDMAGKFASGALKPIAPSIGTMAGSAAKSFALKATQSTREAAWEKVKDGGRFVASLPGRAFGAISGRGKTKGGAAGGANTGGGGPASQSSGDDLPENEDTMENEDDATLEEDTGGALRVNEGGAANAQSVRPRAANTGNFKPRDRGTYVASARMSEAPSGRKTDSPRMESSAPKDESMPPQRENKVEKARQSGRRKQGGRAQNTSRRARSDQYQRNRGK